MMTRFRRYALAACAVFLAFGTAIFVNGQTSLNVTNLREQLRTHYQIVALENGLAFVPRDRKSAIHLIEVRNGIVAINGTTVTAQEARERLGQDADLIIRATYLDEAAQRELAHIDSARSSPQAND